MQVVLVAKRDGWDITKGKEYPFVFDTHEEGCDGYIRDDSGEEHWMELPSNSYRYPDEDWHSIDYFAEVVVDPQH